MAGLVGQRTEKNNAGRLIAGDWGIGVYTVQQA